MGLAGAQALGLRLGLDRRRGRPLGALVAPVLTCTGRAPAVAVGPAALPVAPFPPSGPLATLAAVTARAALAPLTSLPAVATAALGATLVAALAHERGGDQRSVAAGAVQLEALGLPPRRPRREDRHDAHPVEIAVDLGPQHVADLCSARDQRGVERAPGLAGTGSTPRPGAVIPGAGELDVDPAGHRQSTLARCASGRHQRRAVGSGRRQRRDHASGSRNSFSTSAGSVPAATSASVTSSRTVRSAARVATHTPWSPAAGPR